MSSPCVCKLLFESCVQTSALLLMQFAKSHCSSCSVDSLKFAYLPPCILRMQKNNDGEPVKCIASKAKHGDAELVKMVKALDAANQQVESICELCGVLGYHQSWVHSDKLME